MSLKNTVEKIKNLEAEKLSLTKEVEELKRVAEAKAGALANDIASLREEINSLKMILGEEKLQPKPIASPLKESNLALTKDLAEEAFNSSNQLGNQVFASQPFSQNYEGWLGSLRQVVSRFESGCPSVDDQFVKESSQILLDVEAALAQKKAEEANIDEVAKALADNNHLLVLTDKEYAEKARELNLARESEIHRLSSRVQDLEKEIKIQEEENSRRKLLKKKTDDKIPQLQMTLKSAKMDLESAQKNSSAEQNKLDASYEGRKQAIMGKVESLRQELEMLESDRSMQARQEACKALATCINGLISRTASKI